MERPNTPQQLLIGSMSQEEIDAVGGVVNMPAKMEETILIRSLILNGGAQIGDG